MAATTPATISSSPVDFIANDGHTRSPTTLCSVRPGPLELGVLLTPHEGEVHGEEDDDERRDEQDVHRVEPADDVGAGPLAAEDQVRQAFADEWQGEDDGVGDAQPGARQQVVGQ